MVLQPPVLTHSEARDLNSSENEIRTALADQEGPDIKFETARTMIIQVKIVRSARINRQSSAIYVQAAKLSNDWGPPLLIAPATWSRPCDPAVIDSRCPI